ncbi:MAG: hypothetical protein GC155_18355 [Alphaproteobacteria bacterium]|nr:hypothetical protein [Alphaproteobacteria bacterium]
MGDYDLSAWPLFRSVIDDPSELETRPRKCLVISAVDDPNPDMRRHAETVLKYIVRPALLDSDLAPHRFETGEAGGALGQPVIDAILDDDLVIAIASFQNPHACYAAALAQAAARPLILMIEDGQSLSFEPRGAKVVTYSLDTDSVFSAVNVRRLQQAMAELREHAPLGQPFRAGAVALNSGSNGATVYEHSRQFTYDRRLRLVREADASIDMMGVANMAFALHPDAIEVIRSRSGQNVEFRILQCAPANPGLLSMFSQRDPQYLNTVRAEIEAAADAWKRICELPDLDLAITVRRSQTMIPLASTMITDREVVSTPYLASQATSESPTLHALAGSSFHAVMQGEFDQLWSESATVFRAEPRSSPRHQPPANGNALRIGEPLVSRHAAPAPTGGLLRGLSSVRGNGHKS